MKPGIGQERRTDADLPLVSVDSAPGDPAAILRVLLATGAAMPDALNTVWTSGAPGAREFVLGEGKRWIAGMVIRPIRRRMDEGWTTNEVELRDLFLRFQFLDPALMDGLFAGWPVNQVHKRWETSDRELDLSRCSMMRLPEAPGEMRSLSLNDTPVESLPANLWIKEDLFLQDCKFLNSLPPGLRVGGILYLDGCTALDGIVPEDAEIGHLQVDGRMVGRPGVLQYQISLEDWRSRYGSRSCFEGWR